MILLPNGCKCSGKPGNPEKGIPPSLSIYPKNWNTLKASLKKEWYIAYRFYDPRFPKPKPRLIKGMNDFKTVAERQVMTRSIMKDELNSLINLGFNPFTGECSMPERKKPVNPSEITPDTPLIQALEQANKEIKVGPKVKSDLKSVLKYFSKAAESIDKNDIPLGKVKSRDLRLILNACENVKLADKRKWSDNQFNHYRSHISMLFNLISEDEILDYNPVTKIKKADHTPDPRTTLTPQQRKQVDEHLKIKDPAFQRYVHIFFHSGARTAELLRMQGKHVDLEKQIYKVLIKKRRKMVWVDKTIKDIALPYWTELMQGCGPNDYVFSHGLKPGEKAKDPHDIYDMWNKYVKQPEDKGGLGIDVDMYPLKHLHTTEIMDIMEASENLNSKAAKEIAEHNSHTSTAMVVKIYDTKNDGRHGKKVKGIKNAFA